MGWFLVYRSIQAGQREFAAFRRWIVHAAAEPAAGTARKKPRAV